MGACPKGAERPKRTSGVPWLFRESSGCSVCFKDTKSLLPVSFSFQVLKNTSPSSMAFDPVVGVGLAHIHILSEEPGKMSRNLCVYRPLLPRKSCPQHNKFSPGKIPGKKPAFSLCLA